MERAPALKRLAAAGTLVLASIAAYEGFSSTPYQDEAGVWTNGHGTTAGVTAKSAPVTRAEAADVLKHDVALFQARIDKCFTRSVPPNASGAFTSLAYNIGPSAFCSSTVVRQWNAGNFAASCDAILMWDKLRERGVLRVSKGLHNRRVSERAECRKDLA